MEMTGEYRIPAPLQRVWEALNDPAVLRECIPGCQAVEKVSDTEMAATVVAKVGPVKATFNGKVTFSNIDPPKGYTITGEGKGGVAGFAKGGADVSLEEVSDDTVLRYKAHAQVGGKLAQLGARLIDATAKQLADEFFGNFARTVEAGGPPAEEREPVVADLIADPEVTAVAIEERAEAAAARGFLGGPTMWGLLALLIVMIVLLILR
jgi:carbon monoxide dehydrogenase subunit G